MGKAQISVGSDNSSRKEGRRGCGHSGAPQRLQRPQKCREAALAAQAAERASVKKHQGQGTPVARGAAVETSRLWHPHFASICSLVECPPL